MSASVIARLAAAVIVPLLAAPAMAQAPQPAADKAFTEKLNAYVGCINSLSERSYDSRRRYFSWAAKSGPTGKERIIYGTYTISDSSGCRKNVDKANTMLPQAPDLEAAASAYASAVGKLEPLLKEADDYYTQENYKDDKMAKGKALHPQLVAAWDAFADADKSLRAGVETVNDKRAVEKLAAIEQSDGKNARYHVEALMIQAKRVLKTENTEKPDLAAINAALNDYEALVKATEAFVSSDIMEKTGNKVGSMFVSNAKSYLTTAKSLMRRIRDKVPYSTGDKMMLGGGGGWMVEGSGPRLLRDYNQLIDAYNRGARI